jgi:peptide/nickel transport system ATP-binding protein
MPSAGADAAEAARDAPPLVMRCRELAVHYPIRKGLLRRAVAHVRALDGVSLELCAGRTLALVGESGCGKTTAGKALLQLVRPTAGSVRYFGDGGDAAGTELTRASRAALLQRRAAMQIVFQDPYASLDPRMRVHEILDEGMRSLGVGGERAAREARIDRLLEQVGLPVQAKARYPHEFSGGQRQRIAIARALAVDPRLIVCDEPTSALDVSVQAQILNLLQSLQRERGLAYLFITHNLSIVEHFAHDVAVMYLGRIVERGSVDEVLGAPKHPYTRALLSAVPRIEGGREIIRLRGEPPSALSPPAGCHFHPRCAEARDECRREYPAERPTGGTQQVRCVLYPLR